MRRIIVRPAGASHPPAAEAAIAPIEDVVFDASTYHELFADAPDEGADWLNGFIEAACMLNDRIMDCLQREDRETLKAMAHRLAGTSLSAGALRVGLLARRLEEVAQDATTDSLRDLQEMIAAAFAATRAELSRLISTKAVPVR